MSTGPIMDARLHDSSCANIPRIPYKIQYPAWSGSIYGRSCRGRHGNGRRWVTKSALNDFCVYLTNDILHSCYDMNSVVSKSCQIKYGEAN